MKHRDSEEDRLLVSEPWLFLLPRPPLTTRIIQLTFVLSAIVASQSDFKYVNPGFGASCPNSAVGGSTALHSCGAALKQSFVYSAFDTAQCIQVME